MLKVLLPHVPRQVALTVEGFVAVLARVFVPRVGTLVVPHRRRRAEL